MIAASLQLLHALYAIAAKYGKSYCYPSQDKILELLKNHYDISISRRTLNRWLAFLEGEGYIFRTRRHTRGTDGEISFKSTLYRFGKKALRLLKKIAYPALVARNGYKHASGLVISPFHEHESMQ